MRIAAASSSAICSEAFEVVVDVNGRTQVDGRFENRKMAIERAEHLLSLARFAAVRVLEVDTQTSSPTVIFERASGGATAKAITACVVARAEPCKDVTEVYGFASRRIISRVLRKYLDDQVLLAAELLHSPTALQGLQQEQTLLNQAINIVAAAQARTSRRISTHQADIVWKLFLQVLERAKDDSRLRGLPSALDTDGMDGLSRLVASALAPGERARGITYAVARRLEPARDWGLKLDILCRLLETAKGQDSIGDLDEMVAEALESTGAIRVLAGGAANLAEALHILIGLARGIKVEADRPGGTPLRHRLSKQLSNHPMPQSQDVLFIRIAHVMDGLATLTRSDRASEARAFEAIASKLCELGSICGGSAMVAALVRRGSRALSPDATELPVDEAVGAVVGILPDPVTRISTLIDLMETDIGKEREALLLSGVEKEFAAVRSVQEFFPHGASPDVVAEIGRRFGQKLNAGGIPKDLAHALSRRLRTLSQQGFSPSPVTVILPSRTANGPSQSSKSVPRPRRGGEEEETMMCDIRTLMAATSPAKLVLTYQGTTIVFGADRDSLVLGRSAAADMPVSLPTASRRHAVIRRSGAGFVLEDQSRNGSYVLPKDAEPILAQKEECCLDGSIGAIFLGSNWQDPVLGREHMIEYRVVEE